MTEAGDVGLRRMRWRCRRGMRELDVLLERYAVERLGTASTAERRAFERLLELPDPLLAEYLLRGGTPSDPELARLVALIVSPARRA